MKEKVLVGMSGGVDSAVAAYLLKLEGYEVIGITLRTWESADGKESRCCEIDEARLVADRLEIPYHVLNCIADFKAAVTEPFVREYLAGRTPNPCVGCNRLIKWEKMQEAAKVMRAPFVATGHYASVEKLSNGRFSVRKARHSAKDQTYMLYRLTQEQLRMTKMPLGELTKEEVRRLAEYASLPVASKPDSQELCFVTDGNYGDYIEEYAETELPGKGDFIDQEGHVLGTHKGYIHYTVGQRKGLGIALGRPVFVTEIRPENNQVVLGENEELFRTEVEFDGLCLMSLPELTEGDFTAKIRYAKEAAPCHIIRTGEDSAKAIFEEPQRAPTPGQSLVFYDGDYVAGGGVIRG